MLSCDQAMEGLEKNYRKPETHRMMDLDEVSFEMIGDVYNETRDHLDSIRARKTKFVCVNDDMHDPSKELQQMLHDFYVSYFPKPTRFELPNNGRNKILHA